VTTDKKKAIAIMATHHLEPSQNGDNNESETVTNNTCLSAVKNYIPIIGLYSVYSYKSASLRLVLLK